eukprot:Blabericola_migrator_1__399@NODE_109_length_14038_cov_78_087968_g97_i0_p5_GENE_NODE_109_length_14038_cov_78_087968_g97_i0NODE_109_length_14038_cov_78_087968_g97_i0_p5_ORF_typecomplete_len247_score22_64STIMATE/PF12400_8/3_3e33_NODE_109_length_14038_cov_78_087968_g97_i031743914
MSRVLEADNQGECVLFDDPGLYVQGLLGVISFATLIGKRYVESPRRTWTVFLYDAGKQAIGSLFAHSLNLSFASGQSAFTDGTGDECDYYWLNIMMDTTLGVLITYVTLNALLSSPMIRGKLGVMYGYYGDPPKARVWASQLLLWLGITVVMKVTVLVCLLVGQSAFEWIVHIALMPFEGKPDLKLLMVMIITPIVMNTFQYWVTDGFLKYRDHTALDTLEDSESLLPFALRTKWPPSSGASWGSV